MIQKKEESNDRKEYEWGDYIMSQTDKMSSKRIIVAESNIHQVPGVTGDTRRRRLFITSTRAKAGARSHGTARLRVLGIARGICKK